MRSNFLSWLGFSLILSMPAFAGDTVVTPEPGTWLTMAAGVGGLLLLHRMRSKSKPK
jgi:hypothetical protein